MEGRHRHAINVRADGLATVLAPLLRDTRVRAAALVDVDSGMVLDTCVGSADPDQPDPEGLAAGHAELMRIALGLMPGPGAGDSEIVVDGANGVAHVVRTVPDPHGDRLALAVVVQGPPRVVARIRRKLRAVSAAALTAGPSTALRPAADGWGTGPAASPPERFVPRPRPVRPAPDPGTAPEPVPARAPAMVDLPPRDHVTARPPAGPPSAGSIWLAPPVPPDEAPIAVTRPTEVPFATTRPTAEPIGATPPGPSPIAMGSAAPSRGDDQPDDQPVASGPSVSGSAMAPDRRPTPPTALPPGPRRPAPDDEPSGR
ncbi:MAG: hypothetical protein L0I76_25060 [Pseudonocardia sp.]|nr:hypothetical protein [Pseudonocardia sp.]